MTVTVLHRDDLELGGFAGLKEHRLVMDPKAFGPSACNGAWPGIGNFVYLADARFLPGGETEMHGHKEVDVISVMVEGRLAHEGSLEHGARLEAGDIQVQRAGGEGFTHNEINPDGTENRMIQLWVLPETPGQPAGYRHYSPGRDTDLLRVYGGPDDQEETFTARTTVDIARLQAEQRVILDGPVMAYVTRGGGLVEGETRVKDGDLIRGDALDFEAAEDAELIVVRADGYAPPPPAPRP